MNLSDLRLLPLTKLKRIATVCRCPQAEDGEHECLMILAQEVLADYKHAKAQDRYIVSTLQHIKNNYQRQVEHSNRFK